MLKSANTRNINLYKNLHASSQRYGSASSARLRSIIIACIKDMPSAESRQKRILDFGSGKSTLILDTARRIKARGFRYDPAIPEISIPPAGEFDFILNSDVLEHLDNSEIPQILNDIATFGSRVLFCISTRPANTILENGENAHATIENHDWWLGKIRKNFPKAAILWNNDTAVMILSEEPTKKLEVLVTRLNSKRPIDRFYALRYNILTKFGIID